MADKEIVSMAFSNWRIGMHIQQDAIVLVALRYARFPLGVMPLVGYRTGARHRAPWHGG